MLFRCKNNTIFASIRLFDSKSNFFANVKNIKKARLCNFTKAIDGSFYISITKKSKSHPTPKRQNQQIQNVNRFVDRFDFAF
jgi:hypothetical protein